MQRPNGPRITCGNSSTALNPTFLRTETPPAACACQAAGLFLWPADIIDAEQGIVLKDEAIMLPFYPKTIE